MAIIEFIVVLLIEYFYISRQFYFDNLHVLSKFGYFQPYIIVSYNDEMIVARYESQQIVQKIMTDKNLFPTKREILYATYTNC